MRRVWQYTRIGLALAVAIAAGVLVSSLVIDLGPSLKARAEAAASGAIERPLHMGRLSIRLLRGRFVIEDLTIEGLSPGDRPFFTAGRVEVSVHWWNLLRGELLLDTVDLSDWRMLVERFPDGRHSFPRFTRPGPPGEPDEPKRFVTTLAYVRAHDGEFAYDDHGVPWSVVARNLDLTVTKTLEYRGQATFSNGTVQIQDYEPMRADLRTSFEIEGGTVRLDRIDLRTDGAESVLSGWVDFRRWPEQEYQVESVVQFPRMREIFFARERFALSGEGRFDGTFRLFPGGHELKGRFASDLAGLNAYRFPRLRGELAWTRERFEVSHAESDFYGGTTTFRYRMAPLGQPERPRAEFEAVYRDVDLRVFTEALAIEGIRLAGRATGRNRLEWPLGRLAERRGEGRIDVRPPDGVAVRTAGRLPAGVAPAAQGPPSLDSARPSTPVGTTLSLSKGRDALNDGRRPAPLPAIVPVGGSVEYTFDPEGIAIAPSHVASPRTYVAFQGWTAYGDRSRIPFHAVSADWGESHRILAGALTAFGSPTRPADVGGAGTFDGVMLEAFRAPRIEARFAGEAVRAWDVVWGGVRGEVAIENGYADVTAGTIRDGASEIQMSGRFSLAFPRADGAEELDARFRVIDRPVADLRDAFDLEEYPVDGALSGEFHLSGHYRSPFGFGRMSIEAGRAYGEPFESATAGLRFEGKGVRLDGIEIAKGEGTITGAAYVGWDGTYVFDADGRRIPVESIAAAAYPRAPLSGLLQFTASGAGSFDVPRYEVRGRIADLFVLDEGIGQVTGRVGVRGRALSLEVEAASPRLAVSGSGRIALTPEADAELAFRFTNTSLDPYVRAFEPRLSPFTTAVASGTFRVAGELRHLEHLRVDATVEQLALRLFDYPAENDGPIRLTLDRNIIRVDELRLAGEGTRLDLAGQVRLDRREVALRATGDANFGILQGFFRDVRSSGNGRLEARIEGPLEAPLLVGSASVSNGRLRHFELPHSLDEINGEIVFDAGGVHVDGVRARLGGGEVQFGGRIGLRGFQPAELNVTAAGRGMSLRYPEGFRSVVDAELALQRDFSNPLLTGTVTVRDAVWVRGFETDANLLDLAGTGEAAAAPPPPLEPTLPLQFDMRIVAPSTLRIENRNARIVASAELTLRGTYDRPLLFGNAEIERGDVFFEGNRYIVTRGSIDFANPAKIEPFFDIEAETRVQVPGQIYTIVFHAAGTATRFVPELTSDPPLPTVDILSLLFGDVRDPRSAELQSRRAPDETEQKLIQSRAARLLASPISSEVGRVVQETFAVDTFQITPSLGDFTAQQSARVTPTARLLIGKRLSERLFLTFSRALSAANDQLILLEYSQSDRLSWVVSQNEDRTYALDFRVRHAF